MRANILAHDDLEIGEGTIIGTGTLLNKSIPPRHRRRRPLPHPPAPPIAITFPALKGSRGADLPPSRHSVQSGNAPLRFLIRPFALFMAPVFCYKTQNHSIRIVSHP